MPGWFKGMEQIIRERGLWRDGLLAQCTGFKCQPGRTDCCCRRILFTQPDFMNQKSALAELVESRGHICDFYPKYHCELNFIEMYWGAAKFHYRTTPKTANIEEMEQNVKACLDDVPHLQIIRSPNFAGLLLRTTAPTYGWFAVAAGNTRKEEEGTLRGPRSKAPWTLAGGYCTAARGSPVRRLLPTSPGASSSVSPIVVDQRKKMAKLTSTLGANVPPEFVLSTAQHRRGCPACPRSTSRPEAREQRHEQHAHPLRTRPPAASRKQKTRGSTLLCVASCCAANGPALPPTNTPEREALHRRLGKTAIYAETTHGLPHSQPCSCAPT
ncbi:hypothetical protein C8R46DRAFT_1353444 [Mycena filopes]|nr:hypothetical protein C8R46DRAFT_1353444 [Mycena filopes]